MGRHVRRLPCGVVPKRAKGFEGSMFLRHTVMNRHLHLTVNLPGHDTTRRTPMSSNVRTTSRTRACCAPPLVGIVGFTYGTYPAGHIRMASNYRKYLTRPYVRMYPGKTISLSHAANESVVSRRGYVGYNHYTDIYSCGTVVVRRHPYTGTYNVSTVASSRGNGTGVSCSGYISYNRYLMGYPFNTVTSGSRVFRAVHTVRSNRGICTTITPTFINRFKPGIAPNGLHTTVGRLKFTSIFRMTVNTSLYTGRRTRSFLGRIPSRLPFVTASYYPT